MFKPLTRRDGNYAFTESLRGGESGEKQVALWTAEGAVKCDASQSILQRGGMRKLPRDMSVSCISAWGTPTKSRWHRGYLFIRP